MKTPAEFLAELREQQARELAELKAQHALQLKAHRTVRRVLRRHFDPGDLVDAQEHTAAQWAARREPYGNGALVTLTFEGPLYHEVNYGREFVGKLQAELEKEGLLMEQGYAWSAHVYPMRKEAK